MTDIRNVCVLGGSGTVGAGVGALFASFGHASVTLVGRDEGRLEAARGRASRSVRAGTIARRITTRTYGEAASAMADADLVVECVSEDMATKRGVLGWAAPLMREDALLCTGTSGLSVNEMADRLPQGVRGRFLGTHFFNPPYAMRLCEVIPSGSVAPETTRELVEYLEVVLLRRVVTVRDAPGFLANRVGFQSINAAMAYAEEKARAGGIDLADAILGRFTGRAMPPIATSDFVGLDVHTAIVDNIHEGTADWARDDFLAPRFCRELVAEGALGRKAGRGAYARDATQSLTYDIHTREWRPSSTIDLPFARRVVGALHEGDYALAARAVVLDRSEEARACLRFLTRYVVYAVTCALEVAEEVHDVDVAMAEGFGWCPPLAMYEWLSLAGDFPELSRELSGVPEAGLDRAIAAVEPSRYDYRPFLRAKV